MEPATTPRHRARRLDTEARRVSVHQLPWRQVTNPYPPIQPLSADQIESIHIASLRILKEIGMKVLLPEARRILRQAGADVDEASQIVKFESGLVEQALTTVPAKFTLHARNPAHDIVMGGNHVNFGTVGGPPYAHDLARGRRRCRNSRGCRP